MSTLTVDKLISDVRSCLDEVNNSHVKDDKDILPALNRSTIRCRHPFAFSESFIVFTSKKWVSDFALTIRYPG